MSNYLMTRVHQKSTYTVMMLIFFASLVGAVVFGFVSNITIKENDLVFYVVTAGINTIQSWIGVQLFLHIDETNRLHLDLE